MSSSRRLLGQHFLQNRSAIKKIVAALELRDGDTLVEIGAGHGELTKELRIMNSELRIVAIEKDEKLVDTLRKNFAQDKNIEIVEGDALKLLPVIIHNSLFKIHGYKLLGNIPYYITGRLLRVLSELENKPVLCVLTVQKEVAERIVAEPRMNPVRGREGPQRASASNGMNRLAAAVQFWAEPRIIARISRRDFKPVPDVDSSIIKLQRKEEGGTRKDEERYYAAVRMLFAQPRQTILNNMRRATKLPKEEIETRLKLINIRPEDRPQNLSVKDVRKIAGAAW